MTTTLAVRRTLLEKAAHDNGFDLDLPAQGAWLGFASSHAPLRLWLGTFENALYVAAFSQHNVAQALDVGTPMASPLPDSAVAGRTASTLSELSLLVRRAYQLSRTLPDELLTVFHKKVAGMPRSTEAERLVVQRVGQDVFRGGLLDYWDGRCAITGLAVPQLLRASHAKPWADCETDAERLDVYNGFLLAPHMDLTFDQGFITVLDDGAIEVSPVLDAEARRILGLDRPLRVRRIEGRHREYLAWHRGHVFDQPARREGQGL